MRTCKLNCNAGTGCVRPAYILHSRAKFAKRPRGQGTRYFSAGPGGAEATRVHLISTTRWVAVLCLPRAANGSRWRSQLCKAVSSAVQDWRSDALAEANECEHGSVTCRRARTVHSVRPDISIRPGDSPNSDAHTQDARHSPLFPFVRSNFLSPFGTMRAAAAIAFILAFHFTNLTYSLLHGRDDVDPDVQLHNVQLQNCPIACEYVTSDTSTWTTYHSFEELELCDDTVLFTFNVQSEVVNPHIKACLTSTSGPQMQAGAYYGLLQNNVTSEPTPEMVPELVMSKGKRVKSQDGFCGASTQDATMDVETRWTGQGSASTDKVSAALSQLEQHFRKSGSCGRHLMFVRASLHAVAAAFAGGDMVKSSVADVIGAHTESILGGTIPAQYAVQTVRGASKNGSTSQGQFDTRLGLFADLTGNVSSVQLFLADYINNMGEGVNIQDMEGGESPVKTSVTILGSTVASNATQSHRSLGARGLCRDIQVIKDDGCGSLASRCGISGFDFEKLNSKVENLCGTLKEKQYVCCTEGDLPDHTPQPNADGTCFTYEVKANDGE